MKLLPASGKHMKANNCRSDAQKGGLQRKLRGATLLVALFPSQVAERAGVSPGQQAQGRRERTVAARAQTRREHSRQCMFLHVMCFGASSFEASWRAAVRHCQQAESGGSAAGLSNIQMSLLGYSLCSSISFSGFSASWMQPLPTSRKQMTVDSCRSDAPAGCCTLHDPCAMAAFACWVSSLLRLQSELKTALAKKQEADTTQALLLGL